jgi:eukaryotic-like serine/threonine-protein kinase
MFEAISGERRGLETGDVLGRYQIRGRIGTGGFCSVYRAWDPAIQREVALKTCDSLQKPILERFAREAQLAGGLDHPNIVRIYDFQNGDGPYFIVQEFLPGEDLEKRLARREPMALVEKARILAQIARGLAHAHARGIVHRDIKPANIRLLPGGGVKIMDFGIAKSLNAELTMTRPGATIGSLGYMAPEQIEGGEVDHRTDLFALGVVAYELFAGHKPFGGEGLDELFERILNDEPEPLSAFAPQVPVELDALILRCLEKDPTRRPASADEVRRELEESREKGIRP